MVNGTAISRQLQIGRWLAVPLLGVSLLWAPANAGTGEVNPQMLIGANPVPSANLLDSGLIDLSRFSLSHSLSYGVSSSSYGTASGGLWVSQLGYRISDPLRVSVDIGAVINGSGGDPMLSTNNIFLRGFNLDYSPSKSFRLHVSYRNQPVQFGRLRYPGLGHRTLNPVFGSGQ